MARYVALVDGQSGAYGVTVPDLSGCTSAGSTTDEVLRNAIEAVRLWAEDAIADGEELPTPRSVEVVHADAEVAAAIAEGAALAIVPLLIDVGRPTKANLSLGRPSCSHRRGRRRPWFDAVGVPRGRRP